MKKRVRSVWKKRRSQGGRGGGSSFFSLARWRASSLAPPAESKPAAKWEKRDEIKPVVPRSNARLFPCSNAQRRGAMLLFEPRMGERADL